MFVNICKSCVKYCIFVKFWVVIYVLVNLCRALQSCLNRCVVQVCAASYNCCIVFGVVWCVCLRVVKLIEKFENVYNCVKLLYFVVLVKFWFFFAQFKADLYSFVEFCEVLHNCVMCCKVVYDLLSFV